MCASRGEPYSSFDLLASATASMSLASPSDLSSESSVAMSIPSLVPVCCDSRPAQPASLVVQRHPSTPVGLTSRPAQTALPTVCRPPSTPNGTPSTPVRQTSRPVQAASPAVCPPPSTPNGRPGQVYSRLRVGDCPPVNPNSPVRITAIPGCKKNTWYAVIAGRRTGVFDDWYVIR